MRIGITGPTSVAKVCEILDIDEEDYYVTIRSLAERISKTDHSVVMVPYKKSVPEFFAEVYTEEDGKEVTGIVPEDDSEFGISLLNRAACDKVINAGTWNDVPSTFLKNIDVLLVLGFGRNAFIHIGFTSLYNVRRIILVEDLISARLPQEMENGLRVDYVKSADLMKVL